MVQEYFYGNEVSPYGKEHGYVDYECLAKAVGDMVLNNDIIKKADDWEPYCGLEYNEDEDYWIEFYQYYIISEWGARFLARETEECVYYSEELGIYLWGITHWGTGWDYVLTNIELEETE